MPTTRGSSSSKTPLPLGGDTMSSMPYTQPAGNGFGAAPARVGASPVQVGATQASGAGWDIKNQSTLVQSGQGHWGPNGEYISNSAPTGQTSGGSGSLQSSINSLLGSLKGGSTTPVAASSYNPGTFSVQAQENPQLAALIGQFGQARGQIAAGSDQDAQLAMQRQRDVTSGMASEFGTEAASRGILNSGAAQQDLMKRVVNPGQAQMGQLNANLASDSRNKQLSALQGEASMVGQQAGLTQNQQQFGLQSWQAQQQAQQAQAQLAALQQNQGVSNLSSIVGLIGSLGNLYSGF